MRKEGTWGVRALFPFRSHWADCRYRRSKLLVHVCQPLAHADSDKSDCDHS